MKLKLFALVLVLSSMGACTQYTCPTYSKVKKEKPAQQVERTSNQEDVNV
ncbi:hypothetical protein [Persicobacter psychrovividus]|uniref:Lipoprotein n=1 Tax=Persicobacter psychrovividus TaxID=387638 RepID=A0ABN6L8H6_9BACT|nr:hypothetical protein PEPS_17600 [Persicobacter psychrovividus]